MAMGVELGTDVTAASAAAAVLAEDEELSYQAPYVPLSSGTELILGGAAPAAITRKLQTVLSMRLDQGQLLSALEALSTLMPTNTTESRRSLRGDAERQSLAISKRYNTEALDAVRKSMEALERDVDAIGAACREMQENLDDAHAATHLLHTQASLLRGERDKCDARRRVAATFLERFTLSPEEVATITTAKELKADFFAVLRHLQQIQADCRQLLVSEHQRAGLDIMESIAAHQDSAFEKLYRWAQLECRALNKESPDIPATLIQAMRALADRAVLFSSCAEELCAVRRTVVAQSFITALTKGSPHTGAKPIELLAHDPMRYVGDMLAWLHQTAASEREMVESLILRPADAAAAGGSATPVVAGSAFPPLVANLTAESLLDQVMEGACRPLKLRLEQILVTQADPLLSYRISNIIRFYAHVIPKIIGPDAKLSKLLAEVTQSSFRLFHDALRHQTDRQLRSLVVLSAADLAIPQAIQSIGMLLKEILAIYHSSLLAPEQSGDASAPLSSAAATAPGSGGADDIELVLAALLDPTVQAATAAAASLPASASAAFMINCLQFLETSLSAYGIASARAEGLRPKIDQYVEQLAEEHFADIAKKAHLASTFASLRQFEANKGATRLSMLPGMDVPSLTAAMDGFSSFLYAFTPDAYGVRSVLSSRLARQVQHRALRAFADAYRALSDAIHDPFNRYEFPSTIVSRTPAEVETILGVDA